MVVITDIANEQVGTNVQNDQMRQLTKCFNNSMLNTFIVIVIVVIVLIAASNHDLNFFSNRINIDWIIFVFISVFL